MGKEYTIDIEQLMEDEDYLLEISKSTYQLLCDNLFDNCLFILKKF